MRNTTIHAMALGIMVAAAATATVGAAVHPASAAPASSTTVTEDDPRWDCTTMGNQVCAPSNPQGAHPGQYAYGNLIVSWPVVKRCHRIEATGYQMCKTEPALNMAGDW